MAEEAKDLRVSNLGSDLDAALTTLESVLEEASRAVAGIRSVLPQISALGEVVGELESAMTSARQHLAPQSPTAQETAPPMLRSVLPAQEPEPSAPTALEAPQDEPEATLAKAEPEPAPSGPSWPMRPTPPAVAPPEPVDLQVEAEPATTPPEGELIVTPAEAAPVATPPEGELIATPSEGELIVTPAEAAPAATPAEAEPVATPPEGELIATPAEGELIVTPAEAAPAATPAEAEPQPISSQPQALQVNVRTASGSLDLKAVDRSVNEIPAVVDVTLLEYDGRNATLKVWINQSADPVQVREALLGSLRRHLAEGQDAEVHIDFDEQAIT